MEEERGIVKDEKPYLIFKCSKCEQYMYVKPSQNTKKCLRCGRHHKVSKLEIVDEVKGMSAAVSRVKELQNEFSLKHVGDHPSFKGEGGFSVASSKILSIKSVEDNGEEDTSYAQFHCLLKELSKYHSKFPLYMIELMVKDYGIKRKDLFILIKHFVKKGILKAVDHNYYTLS